RLNFGFVALLALELALALGLGIALWKLLEFVLTLSVSLTVRAVLVLASGYGVFVLSNWLRTTTSEQLPFEVLVEPLLVCMLAGFLITNFGESR
ncbi:MAG: potassium transporter TrkA, partial [Burkholderiales bacterium]|nr:potassium transporter TrkA [Burkholderiales bacterium]